MERALKGFDQNAVVDARAASGAVDESQGLTWLPAWRLAELVARREVSAVEVARHFLDRIAELDPGLHAFRFVDAAGALEQAERADEAVRAGDPLGPLHGIPVAVKEPYDVRGFPVPLRHLQDPEGPAAVASRDDIAVERLRAAGAVIVGATVAALGPWPGMPDPGSLPRNPWDTSRSPAGSDAGTPVAVAAGMVPVGVGGDGAGSVRVPSAFCGLLGLAPTRGRVPRVDYRSGVIDATSTVGLLTRSAEDSAIALQAIAGPDGRDPFCVQDDPPDYRAGLRAGIEGMRFLWADHFGKPRVAEPLDTSRTVGAIQASAGRLEAAGGSISNAALPWRDPLLSWVATHRLVGKDVSTIFLGHTLSEAELVEGMEIRDHNWRLLREALAEHDFVVSPAVQITAPRIDAPVALAVHESGPGGNPVSFSVLYAHTMMCNVLGVPAITIPAGFEDGLPLGLQVIGPPGSEAGLLRVAHAVLAGEG